MAAFRNIGLCAPPSCRCKWKVRGGRQWFHGGVGMAPHEEEAWAWPPPGERREHGAFLEMSRRCAAARISRLCRRGHGPPPGGEAGWEGGMAPPGGETWAWPLPESASRKLVGEKVRALPPLGQGGKRGFGPLMKLKGRRGLGAVLDREGRRGLDALPKRETARGVV